MRRRTFLAGALAGAGAWGGAWTAGARQARAISITANLRAAHGGIARQSRYGTYDPLCLASAHAGGALLCAALYEGLYRRDGGGNIKHALARETRADAARKRWTLRLAAPQGGRRSARGASRSGCGGCSGEARRSRRTPTSRPRPGR